MSQTCASCGCTEAENRAIAAAEAAETLGTTIIAVHYVGHGCGSCSLGSGLDFMRDEIATGSDFFFDGSVEDPPGVYESRLICAFSEIVEAISCDDSDMDTWDCCIDGYCRHGSECGQ